jgi:hypothetical protein
MSADFGIDFIISAGNLCYQIFDRCKNSRGKFKDFSIKARNLRGILRFTADVLRRESLPDEHLASLKDIIDPLIEVLDTIKA